MSTNNPQNEYICVFENAGYEIPSDYLGVAYNMSTSYNERKRICQSTTQNSGNEAGLYIKKTDWIQPSADVVCALYNLDNVRLTTKTGDPRKTPSKEICDVYNTPKKGMNNSDGIIYSKLIPNDIINPVTDYTVFKTDINADKYSSVLKNQIIWTVVLSCSFLYIFYVFKYQQNRSYFVHDFTQHVFIRRIIIMICLIGFFIYIYCPYGTCYHELLTPAWRKDPSYGTHQLICNNIKNFRAKRTADILYLSDILLDYYNNISICNNLLNIISSNRFNTFYQTLYGCDGCSISTPCIKRYGNHYINFFINPSNNSYFKKCVKCNMLFCQNNRCHPLSNIGSIPPAISNCIACGKDKKCNNLKCYYDRNGIYDDTCIGNIIIEHDIVPFEYSADKIVMQCRYCFKKCNVNL